MLYLATIHPSFKDAGDVYDNLRYFSGPKLIEVARRISKEWGTWIKFDRSRTATNKYGLCKDDGYVKIRIESGNNKLFALTKEGFRRCKEIVNWDYRNTLHKNLSKVRVIAINKNSKNIYFLALKEDASFVLCATNNNLKGGEEITENSLIEYHKKDVDTNSGPFQYRIEHIENNSLRILEDDDSILRTSDIKATDIEEIKLENVENKLYYIRGKVVDRWSPKNGGFVDNIDDIDTGQVTIQDSTGKISYFKMPYDSSWREETMRVGTEVEAVGIFKSRVKLRENTLPASLYAPYKVEFFRPLRHSPQQVSGVRNNTQQIRHPMPTTPLPSIEDISNNDPCISIPAAEQLARQNNIEFESFTKILKQEDLGIVNQYVLRALCKAFPKQSAPILLKMILEANDDWFAAGHAANCLGPAHREFVQGELIRNLKKTLALSNNANIVRRCIEGLGNIDVDHTQYNLTNSLYIMRPGFGKKIKDPLYEKYYLYVCRALARIFVRSDIGLYDRLWQNSSDLQNMMLSAINDDELLYHSPTVEDVTKEVFVQCTSLHVDVLVENWLYSEEIVFRKLGAFALGIIRNSRAVPHLIKILNHKGEHVEVLDEVSTALGSIGGIDAVKALLHRRRLGAIGYALGELTDFELYDYSLQRYLQSLKDSTDLEYLINQLYVYRAIGLKKDNRYTDLLRQLLFDSQPAIRGVAALALARINGSEELTTLTKAYEESGSPGESIMTGLGLLLIKSPESNDILVRLRKDLTIDSQTHDPYISDWRFQSDILSILRNTRKPLAALIANSWELVYRTRGD